MTEISRTALFGKLNSLLYQGIESATVFCKMRGNPYVVLVHWLQQILQLQDSDLRRIVDHFDIEIGHRQLILPRRWIACRVVRVRSVICLPTLKRP